MARLTCLLLFTAILCSPAVADIYEWEYIDPSDPSQGKRQSLTLTPDGAGVELDSILSVFGRDLSKAYLPSASLFEYRLNDVVLDDAYLRGADFSDVSKNAYSSSFSAQQADFSGANLAGASLPGAYTNLSDADFSGANLTGARLGEAALTRANLSGARLRETGLESADVTGAIFTNADINGANFAGSASTGFTPAQLYSTASYASRQLGAVGFSGNDLAGWSFADQQMDSADFSQSQLTGAVFDGAVISNANFSSSNLSAAQLYSTASHQQGELGAIVLRQMNISGWDFADQALVQSQISSTELSGASFDRADLTRVHIGGGQFSVQSDVSFRGATLSHAIFDTNGRWERVDFAGADLEDAKLSNNGFQNADFTDAIVRGAEMHSVFNHGFTLANLYATRSYQTGDLTRIDVLYGDLTSANFSGIDLSNASLAQLVLDGADFRQATLIGATIGATLDGADFRGADLTDAHLSYDPVGSIDFRGANLTGASLERTSLANADLTDAIVYGTRLSVENSPQDLSPQQLYSTASYKAGLLGAITLAGDMRGWDFRGQNLEGARFDRNSDLTGAHWDGANLSGATFVVNELPGADFSAANVRGANFDGNFAGADFHGADLTGANFRGSDLTGATFENAILAPTATSGDGPDLDGANLTNASLVGADLRYGGFYRTNVTGADFSNADIRYANLEDGQANGFSLVVVESTRSFQEQDLSGVRFDYWELPGVDLADFMLERTRFYAADLSNARFSNAQLTNANLTYANLSNADFSGADLSGAEFYNNIGIETVNFQDAVIRGASFTIQSTERLLQSQLTSTRSYQEKDLAEVTLMRADLSGFDFSGVLLANARFDNSDLTDANFSGADLSGARLTSSTLDGAEFTNAKIQHANLAGATDRGFDAADLYTTRSYQERDLRGVNLTNNDLTGWDFTEVNLAKVNFTGADATGGTFDRADLRGATLGTGCCRSPRLILDEGALQHAITPDGELEVLSLSAGQTLTVRNDPRSPDNTDPELMGIRVGATQLHDGGTLRIVLDECPWLSILSIASTGRGVALNGELELDFDPEADPQNLIGQTFNLFDWQASPNGAFDIAADPNHVWDLSRLYTTGEATLVALDGLTVTLAGDFNLDGVVNAADYAVWRDNVGRPVGTLLNDTAADGVIGPGQYALWAANFGARLAASTAAPEPAAVLLALAVVGSWPGRSRRD